MRSDSQAHTRTHTVNLYVHGDSNNNVLSPSLCQTPMVIYLFHFLMDYAEITFMVRRMNLCQVFTGTAVMGNVVFNLILNLVTL